MSKLAKYVTDNHSNIEKLLNSKTHTVLNQ